MDKALNSDGNGNGNEHDLPSPTNTERTSASSLPSTPSTPSEKAATKPKDDNMAVLPTKTTKLKWGKVEIRDYGMIVGDNPSVSVGPPLTIEWFDYNDESAVYTSSIKHYEKFRNAEGKRTFAELRIPKAIRISILKNSGFTDRQIQEGAKAANIGRNGRKKTQEVMGLGVMTDKVKMGFRGALNATIFKGKKKKEKEQLELGKELDDSRHSVSSVSSILRDKGMGPGTEKTLPDDSVSLRLASLKASA